MPNMKCKNGNNNISNLQFYNYIKNGFNPYLNLGKISQQAIIDAFVKVVKVESLRLYFIRKNQTILRSDCYKGVMDYLHKQKSLEIWKLEKC